MPENLHLLLLLIIIIILFGKATALPQRNMSKFSADPSLKYPYPVQKLFIKFSFSNGCSKYGTKQL